MLRFATALIALRSFAQAPDAADIAKHVEKALGWTGKFDTVISLQIEGTLDGAPIQVSAKQPSLFRMDLTEGQDHIVQAYDGSFGWQTTIGDHAQPVSELSGGSLDQLIDQASNAIGGPWVQAPERGTHIEYEGRQTIEGKDCYKLKLTLISGSVIHSYVDVNSFLEAHEQLISGDGKRVIEEAVSDYRTFGGIQFPCRFVSHSPGESKSYELSIQTVTLNPKFAPGWFAMPSHQAVQ